MLLQDILWPNKGAMLAQGGGDLQRGLEAGPHPSGKRLKALHKINACPPPSTMHQKPSHQGPLRSIIRIISPLQKGFYKANHTPPCHFHKCITLMTPITCSEHFGLSWAKSHFLPNTLGGLDHSTLDPLMFPNSTMYSGKQIKPPGRSWHFQSPHFLLVPLLCPEHRDGIIWSNAGRKMGCDGHMRLGSPTWHTVLILLWPFWRFICQVWWLTIPKTM
jgi:hypothetical protein